MSADREMTCPPTGMLDCPLSPPGRRDDCPIGTDWKGGIDSGEGEEANRTPPGTARKSEVQARFSEPESQQLLGIGPAVKQQNEPIDQLQLVTVITPARVGSIQRDHLPSSFALLHAAGSAW